MRKLLLSLLLAAGGAVGLAGSTAAQADSRIYIGLGDVTFSYGRPYWRYNHEPLYVVYERGYPRYYRIGASGYRPGYPPPRYYRDRDWRYDGRWDRDRGWDRDWDRDRRHWRHRDRHRHW